MLVSLGMCTRFLPASRPPSALRPNRQLRRNDAQCALQASTPNRRGGTTRVMRVGWFTDVVGCRRAHADVARFVWLSVLAALSGCGDSQPGQPSTAARIDALEAKVQQLSQQLQPSPTPTLEQLSATFDIQCPVPWQALGAVADTAWACRADQALPSGWWPNCNVTGGRAEPSTQPKAYFDASLESLPQLRAARRIVERNTTLGAAPAHEVVYEHDLLPKPLRVLATVVVHADRAYAVSCSAPPEAFAASEPMFRKITQSFRFRP
jgi:hypothetical protein